MRKLVIYLSGPMTGIPDDNIPAFHAAANQLRQAGHKVISPAELELDPGMPPSWVNYLRRDLAAMCLEGCDTIALMDGHHRSRGCTLELHVARSLELGIYTVAEILNMGAPAAPDSPPSSPAAVPDPSPRERLDAWASAKAAEMTHKYGTGPGTAYAEAQAAIAAAVATPEPAPTPPASPMEPWTFEEWAALPPGERMDVWKDLPPEQQAEFGTKNKAAGKAQAAAPSDALEDPQPAAAPPPAAAPADPAAEASGHAAKTAEAFVRKWFWDYQGRPDKVRAWLMNFFTLIPAAEHARIKAAAGVEGFLGEMHGDPLFAYAQGVCVWLVDHGKTLYPPHGAKPAAS